MIRPISGEDEQYKYMLKILKLRFHNALGYEGDDFEFMNTELIPQTSDHKYMDGHYKSGDVQYNPEFQSTPVYEPKMEDMYKYMIYSLSEEYSEFHSYIFATYPPTQGIREIKIGDVVFKPDFFFTKNFHASEIIKTVEYKNKHNIQLTDREAIFLLIAPDMTHNYPIAELLEITSRLLVNATVDGQDFHADLIDCQRKVLKRFLESEQRREIENMMNLKAEDFGFEPHVTGFEESVNLAYLDGARDGEKAGFADGRKAGFAEGINKSKEETAKKLIELGCDDDFIVTVTEFDRDFVRSLRND